MQLGAFIFDTETLELLDRRGRPVELPPHGGRLLRLLAAAQGRVVPTGVLTSQVWPGVADAEAALVRTVTELRKALGDSGRRILVTVPERGYLLVPGIDPDALLPSLRRWLPVAIATMTFAAILTVILGLQIVGRTDRAGPPPVVAVAAIELAGQSVGWADRAAGLREALEDAVAGLEGATLLTGEDEAGASYRVTGTVLPRGEQVLVRAVLVDTARDREIWSGEWVRPEAAFDGLVTIVATAVAEALARR